MLNDLLKKLLGGIGFGKTETIRVGDWSNRQSTPTSPVEQYQAPATSKIANYTATPTPQTYTGYGRKAETKKVAEPVYGAISAAANKFKVPLDLMLDLGFSESSLDPQKTNKDAPDINPTGLYQFTNSTWKDVLNYAKDPKSSLYGVLPTEDRTDPLTNALAAAYLIKMGQLGKWDASEWNWGEQYTPQELEALGFYDQSLYHKKGVRPSIRLKGK